MGTKGKGGQQFPITILFSTINMLDFYPNYQVTIERKNIPRIFRLMPEELDHMTYPYKINKIEFDDLSFELNHEISCPVEYEEDTYFIKFEDLDINVWGSSREEVEEAFVFSFYSLYKIYYLESDENLSEKAILLKKKLHKMIKNVNSKELQS